MRLRASENGRRVVKRVGMAAVEGEVAGALLRSRHWFAETSVPAPKQRCCSGACLRLSVEQCLLCLHGGARMEAFAYVHAPLPDWAGRI